MHEGPTVSAVCIYADADGMSHLIDVDLPAMTRLVDDNGKSRFIGILGATSMGFITGTAGEFKDWHAASMAGLSICLAGEWEIEAGSGQRRILRTGSVLLMLDTHGQGHRSRSLGDVASTVIGVSIDTETQSIFTALVEQAAAAQSN